jgi:hypothetical protein
MSARILPIVALALSAVPEHALAQAAFTRNDYASAPGARAIVAADFNRDGWIDVAHAGSGANTVDVLLSAGGKALAHAQTIAVGNGPFDMTAADFNRDGRPDLAVAVADENAVSILIGDGAGSFTRTNLSTAPLRGPRGIASGDVNADGIADLVYSAYDSAAVQVLLGNGAGAFSKAAPLAGAARPQGIAIADVNRDGRMDIAVAHDGGGGLRIWRGATGGAFTPSAVAGASSLNVLAVADLNADGWLDVAAASTSAGHVAVYTGGSSGLVHRRSYPVDADPRAIIIADANVDGVADLITASRGTGTVNVLPADAAHRGTFLSPLTFTAGLGSRAVAAGDFDADGRLDLAVGNQYAANVSLLSNATSLARAGFTFARADIAAPALVSTSPLATADFNRDGRADLVSRSGGSASGFDAVAVLLSGQPGVVLPGPFPFAGFIANDFNGDGNPDILYLASDSSDLGGGVHTRLLTYLGNGRGAFAGTATWTSPVWMRRCLAGDMNRDARLDLVCVGFDNTATTHVALVVLGNGNGTFRAGAGTPLPDDAIDLQLADVNRDGALDVVVLEPAAARWLHNQDGSLSPAGSVDLTAVPYPQHLRAADVNHDARPDLVVAGNDGELAVAAGAASGFAAATVSKPLQVGGEFEVVDIDADGNADILAPGVVLRGSGDGMFGEPEGFAFWGPFGVADVTLDGLPDLLTHAASAVRVLVNERNEINHSPVLTAADRTLEYHEVIVDPLGEFDCPALFAEAVDPDQHAVTYEWRDGSGALIATSPDAHLCTTVPGTYAAVVTVRDGRGATESRRVTLTIRPGKEIVVYAVNLTGDDDVWQSGEWTQVADPTGVGGFRAATADRGAAKVTAPAVNPASAVLIRFTPDPAQTYKLWVRLKAERNSYWNDSVWVQFSGATDAGGMPVYRIGTISALAINLEACASCGLAGWGWEDDGWGAVNRNGVTLRFPDGGRQTILIQTREDGVSVDQVVLSSENYLSARPGLQRNDRTILPRTYQVNPH